ncbi:nitrous oxide reductase family maturation protein NosD [bacterium]|nr:nitrous oxide reductase family maturation protein NosD [bacterium]
MKNHLFLLVLVIQLFIAARSVGAAENLQRLIDQTPVGGTLVPPPGTYQGPVVINKQMILDGRNQVVVDNHGKGSVVLVKADRVTIRNMQLTNSGDSHDRLDAGILVRSSDNRILDNLITDCLFGIDLQEAHRNEIIGNDISSKKVDLGIRGDGVRIWASHKNIFRKNRIHDSRDMVIWYSNDNLIEDNEGWNNRYSLHFMFAGGNLVQRNSYHHNTVGIFLMYSRDAVVVDNLVKYSLGGTGIGIGLKEVDNMTIMRNKILYCTAGFYFDLSPFQPDTYNFLKGNEVAYNVVGADFNSSLPRNVLKGNAFIDNLETVQVHGNGTATDSIWEGNYYSDYEGFDRDGDGYGDSTYHYDIYFETLWMGDDWMRFFYGSPVISVLNFVARLAPVSEPRRLMSDHKPVFKVDFELLTSAANLFYNPPVIDVEADDNDENDDNADIDDEMAARYGGSSSDKDEEDDADVSNIDTEAENYNRYYHKQ